MSANQSQDLTQNLSLSLPTHWHQHFFLPNTSHSRVLFVLPASTPYATMQLCKRLGFFEPTSVPFPPPVEGLYPPAEEVDILNLLGRTSSSQPEHVHDQFWEHLVWGECLTGATSGRLRDLLRLGFRGHSDGDVFDELQL